MVGHAWASAGGDARYVAKVFAAATKKFTQAKRFDKALETFIGNQIDDAETPVEDEQLAAIEQKCGELKTRVTEIKKMITGMETLVSKLA